MKKFYKVEETKKNTYRKKTVWSFEKTDLVTIGVCVLTVGYVVVRCLIG